MTLMKPNRLKSGDKVAVVSPSWGGPSMCPHIYENGIKYLTEQLKLEIVEFPTARMSATELASNPKIRAKDINDAFANREIKAVISTIGGDDYVRILRYLDKDTITCNPKILLGYSDTTTLNTLLNTWGLVTFNGPSIMAGFSQANQFPKSWHDTVKTILMGDSTDYIYPRFEKYSNGYPSWSNVENTGLVNELIESPQYNWLQGNSIVDGTLFGGCIEVFEFLKSTEYWPAKDFWKDKVLFFETSEDAPSAANVSYMLRNYGVQGIFDQIKALVFGRARDYTEETNQELRKAILSVVREEFGHKDLLVATDFDFGHTDPQWILPLGVRVQINPENKEIKLLEAATV